MKFLFIHQNFPGQYRFLAPTLAARGHEVVGLGEAPNVARQRPRFPGQAVRLPHAQASAPDANPLLRHFHEQVQRGQVAARAAAQLRAKGFAPDLVGAHIGWGEAMFLKEVFPESRLLLFCE